MTLTPPDDEDGEGSPRRANLAALIAVIVLALLAYWAFTAIESSRRLQRCLDEGRRNCVDMQDLK